MGLFDGTLKSEAVIEIGDVFVDSLEDDTHCDVELSLFNLSVDLSAILNGVVTSDQVQLVDSPHLHRVDHFFDVAGGVAQTEVAATHMVDSAHQLGGEVDCVRSVKPSPAEPNPCDSFNLVDALEQGDQLTDDVVDAWRVFTRTDDISSNCCRVEVLSCSGPRPQKFLLCFDGLPCPEAAIFDDELSRFDECLRHQERFVFTAFYFVSDEGTGVSLGLVDLEVDDEVVHLLEGTHDLSHHIQFLEETVILVHVQQFQGAPVLGERGSVFLYVLDGLKFSYGGYGGDLCPPGFDVRFIFVEPGSDEVVDSN